MVGALDVKVRQWKEEGRIEQQEMSTRSTVQPFQGAGPVKVFLLSVDCNRRDVFFPFSITSRPLFLLV